MKPYIHYLLLCCLISASCTRLKTSIKTLSSTDAIDSMVLENLNSTRDFFNLTRLSDSTMVAFSDESNELSTYRKTAKGYSLGTKQNIANSTTLFLAFFIDSAHHKPNFIGLDQNWYRLDTNNVPKLVNHIKLELPSLVEPYCFFSFPNSPVQVTDSSLIMRISATNSLIDYTHILSEKSLCRLLFKSDSIYRVEYLYTKPASLINQFETHAVYCQKNNKLLLVYPCIDSIYQYDIVDKQYTTIPIHNPYYKASEKYDYKKAIESGYTTKISLHNFCYTGIFYNPATRHYVLYYYAPVDKAIKVPTHDDQKMQAIVLDERFAYVKTVCFNNKYREPASYLIMDKGIAMPVFSKKYENEKNYVFHIYDL